MNLTVNFDVERDAASLRLEQIEVVSRLAFNLGWQAALEVVMSDKTARQQFPTYYGKAEFGGVAVEVEGALESALRFPGEGLPPGAYGPPDSLLLFHED